MERAAIENLLNILPPELFLEHILPHVARDWLRVNKFWHYNAFQRLLKDKRVDPTAQNNNAIVEAAENGHVEVVKVLLADKRVDPTALNNSAIRQECQGGSDCSLL